MILTETIIARGVEQNERNSIYLGYYRGGQIVRSDDFEGQGTDILPMLVVDTYSISQITYDLDQLPRQSLPALRDSILGLLVTFRGGPRPIRTQLCVCLANLAIQMIEWKDVLQRVGSTLGSSDGDCILEFLRVLPEEVTEGRKINLTVCTAETPSAYMRTPAPSRAIEISV